MMSPLCVEVCCTTHPHLDSLAGDGSTACVVLQVEGDFHESEGVVVLSLHPDPGASNSGSATPAQPQAPAGTSHGHGASAAATFVFLLKSHWAHSRPSGEEAQRAVVLTLATEVLQVCSYRRRTGRGVGTACAPPPIPPIPPIPPPFPAR